MHFNLTPDGLTVEATYLRGNANSLMEPPQGRASLNCIIHLSRKYFVLPKNVKIMLNLKNKKLIKTFISIFTK